MQLKAGPASSMHDAFNRGQQPIYRPGTNSVIVNISSGLSRCNFNRRTCIFQRMRSIYAAMPMTEACGPSSPVQPVTYGASPSTPAMPPSAADVVLSFIAALNDRDVSGMLLLLADDCHHEDLSHETEARSKEEVARFYSYLVSSMPEKVRVVVDDITSGDPTKVGLTWHMEVDGVEVPCSRGLSFYRVLPVRDTGRDRAGPGSGADCGRISYVRQSPEHFMKLSGMVLSASASATPLIDSLGPLALPNFWSDLARGASNMIASAPPVDEVLRRLAAAGAANTVPSLSGTMMGMTAASSASASGRGGGGGMFSAVAPPGPSGMSSFSRPPMHAHSSPLQGDPGGAPLAGAAFAASSQRVHIPTTDATATTGPTHRASPVVFAASVALADPPSPSARIDIDVRPVRSNTSASCMSIGGSGLGFDRMTSAASAVAAAATIVAEAAANQQQQQQHSAEPHPQSNPASEAAETDAADVSPSQPSVAVPMSSLAGIWEKDLDASDISGYEKALDLWQISGVQKATARLIEGLELAVGQSGGDSAAFNVHFLTIIPYFKVTESYPMGGGRAKMRRRDQRSGNAQAHAEVLSNGVVCRASWGAPFPGELEESYTLPDPASQPDVLHVTSTIRLAGGDRTATTLQVYHRRRQMSARDLIAASERRNGKAQDVLRRFGM